MSVLSCLTAVNRLVSRRVIASVLVAGVVVGVAGCAGSALDRDAAPAPEDAVKVGLLSVLSGPLAQTGKEQNDGFRLYLDRHDGKLGGRRIQLVEADEGATPAVAVAAVERLLSQERVQVISGVTTTAAGLAIAKSTATAKVPVFVTNAAGDQLTTPSSPYLWRTSGPQRELCASAGPPVASATGGAGVHLMLFDAATGRDCGRAVEEALRTAGVRVTEASYAPLGTTDFQPYLARIRDSAARAVYAFLPGADAVAFVKQFAQFGLKGRVMLFGLGSMTEGGLLPAMGDAAVGMRTVLFYSAALDNATNRSFVDAFQARFGAQPGYAGMAGYDAAQALDLALARVTGAASGEAIARELPNIGAVNSPRGSFRFNDNNDPAQHYYLREVRQTGGRLENAVVADLGPPR